LGIVGYICISHCFLIPILPIIMSVLQSWPVEREFDPKDMPFRRLGPSGLRVPLFSLGGCEWKTIIKESSPN